ncbi:Thaumatin-like protein 1 [Ancistrocladus abbreviatus]
MMQAGSLLNVAFIILFCYVSGTHSTTFQFHNNCPYTVWPGVLTSGGSPAISSTGFTLNAGGRSSLGAPARWRGRFWPRTGCSTDSSGKFRCATGDCASGQVSCNGAGGIPPATLAEFTLNGDGNKDFYDISLVDGFNAPLSITVQGGRGCTSPSCASNINNVCPAQLAVKGSDGRVIACKSACLAFNQPQYCCTGSHNTAKTCPPTNFSQIFKRQCPQAYTYAYDDPSSLFACPSGPNYLITFCP